MHEQKCTGTAYGLLHRDLSLLNKHRKEIFVSTTGSLFMLFSATVAGVFLTKKRTLTRLQYVDK